jgi:putative chitinase
MSIDKLVRRLYPHAPTPRRAAFAAQGSALFQRHGLVQGDNRLAFFLAQIGHESSGLVVIGENLNYSAAGLRRVWPRRFPTDAQAAAYANRPEAIANLVYGGRLGNVEPGDGYRYRGRGYIQLTGRDAYRQVGRLTGLPLEQEPALARQVDHLLTVACGFWTWKKLNPVCDTGDFVAVTRIVNGGTVGLAERRAWLARVRSVLETPPVGKPLDLLSPSLVTVPRAPAAPIVSWPLPNAILPEPRGPQA